MVCRGSPRGQCRVIAVGAFDGVADMLDLVLGAKVYLIPGRGRLKWHF
jgi:hypothetical protein